MNPPGDLLSKLEEAPLHLVESIGRYTRFVGLAKLLLIFAVLGLIMLVSGILLWNSHGDKMRVVFSSVAKGAAELPIMLHPRYEGVDANDQPYKVVAEKATQVQKNGKDFMEMEVINADLSQNGGGWLNLTASHGTLAVMDKELLLEGDVSLYQDTGYEMHAPRTMIDLSAIRAYGKDGVEGQGTMGTLRAERFVFDQKANAARFDGNVRVRLYPKSSDASASTPH